MGKETRQDELARKAIENSHLMMDLAATSTRVSNQHTAHMQLYNVAAETGDEESMAKERQILHDLLDQLLDCGSQIGVGLREASRFAREFIQLS
jgi:hypothetical protein